MHIYDLKTDNTANIKSQWVLLYTVTKIFSEITWHSIILVSMKFKKITDAGKTNNNLSSI